MGCVAGAIVEWILRDRSLGFQPISGPVGLVFEIGPGSDRVGAVEDTRASDLRTVCEIPQVRGIVTTIHAAASRSVAAIP